MSTGVSFTDQNPLISSSIFPKKLPKLRHGPVVDEDGFSLTEKAALKQAWNLIKPLEQRYGKDIYNTFLTEYHNAINIFRRKGEPIDLRRLHSHGILMIRFMYSAIHEGLGEDSSLLHLMIVENNNVHGRFRVAKDDICLLIKGLKNYILNVLKNISSMSLVNGLDRIESIFDLYSLPPEEQTTIGREHKSLTILTVPV